MTAASSPGPLGSRLLLSGPGDNLSELADDGRDHLVKGKITGLFGIFSDIPTSQNFPFQSP